MSAFSKYYGVFLLVYVIALWFLMLGGVGFFYGILGLSFGDISVQYWLMPGIVPIPALCSIVILVCSIIILKPYFKARFPH